MFAGWLFYNWVYMIFSGTSLASLALKSIWRTCCSAAISKSALATPFLQGYQLVAFLFKCTCVFHTLSKSTSPLSISPLCGIARKLSGNKIEELHFGQRKQCLWARVHPEALAWGKLKSSQIKYLSMVTQKILDPNPLTPETSRPFAFDRDDVMCFPVPPSEHTSSECALLWLNLLRLLTRPWNACSALWC